VVGMESGRRKGRKVFIRSSLARSTSNRQVSSKRKTKNDAGVSPLPTFKVDRKVLLKNQNQPGVSPLPAFKVDRKVLLKNQLGTSPVATRKVLDKINDFNEILGPLLKKNFAMHDGEVDNINDLVAVSIAPANRQFNWQQVPMQGV